MRIHPSRSPKKSRWQVASKWTLEPGKLTTMNHVHENLMVKVTRHKNYASSSKGRQQYCYKEESCPWECFQPYSDFHNPKYIKTEDRTIGAAQAEKMTMLQEWCCSYKQEKYLDFHNPKYIKQKLKRRIADTFGTKINSVKQISISTYNVFL